MSPERQQSYERERRSIIAGDAQDHVIQYRKKALDKFLLSCGIDPLPNVQETSEHSDRTKRQYFNKTREVVALVIKLIYPDPGSVWKAIKDSESMNKKFGLVPEERPLSPEESKYLRSLSEAYENASTWAAKRQILSLMADLASYKTLLTFIPGLTQYRVTEARRHKTFYGRGSQVPLIRHTKLRVNLCHLEHFINFITSSMIIQDLPFGEKSLKLECGNVIQIPNVIRVSISERIIDQYLAYAAESDVTPLSRSTLRRVLSACSASTRKSLQGLDYFAADAGKAFDNIILIVNTLEECGMATIKAEDYRKRLLLGKQYLKSDYKVSYAKAIF